MADAKAPRSTATKRMSMAPAPPKPPCTIAPSAIIANHALLTGTFPITIGEMAVLHPHTKILSNAGPVHIGEGAVIWERAVVGTGAGHADNNDDEDDEDADTPGRFVMIEKNCVIESGAQVAAKLVGEGTVIEAFARVGDGCVIGKYSKIMPHVVVAPNSIIDDFTIVGLNMQRKDMTAMNNPLVLKIRQASHQKQFKALQALVPSNMAKWVT